MTQLSVNLNKIALLRNSRRTGIPDLQRAARIAIGAGAHGVTLHPRPDQRHARPDDVADLSALAAELDVELNVEGNPFPEFLDLVRRHRPAQCTLVPDEPGALTSDRGWDLRRDSERLRWIVRALAEDGLRVSLFLDPDPEQIERARELGAHRIELYTEPYARAFAAGEATTVLPAYQQAAAFAQSLGLGVNAGHDLNLVNLGPFCAAVPGILEVSIGHALVADALEIGLHGAVRAYLEVLAGARD